MRDSPRDAAEGSDRVSSRAPRLNHVSIHAEDLESSVRFYEELLGLQRLATPEFG